MIRMVSRCVGFTSVLSVDTVGLCCTPPAGLLLSPIMGKGCLITGKSTDLLAEVVQAADARGRDSVVARSGHFTVSEGQSASTITWNRRSALSARSVVLHAQNVFRAVEEAIVVYSVVQETTPFHETSIVSLENRTDAEMKGYLFLLREIVAQFQKQRSGTLVLAVHDRPDAIRAPAEAFSAGGFASFARALQRYYQNEPFTIHLCRSSDSDISGYAHFVLDAAEKSAKRQKLDWLEFPPRGLFRSR